LKEICERFGIVNPFDENQDKETTNQLQKKQEFNRTIQSLCQDEKIFFKYKKDPLEVC
jgi:hypothetical protein